MNLAMFIGQSKYTTLYLDSAETIREPYAGEMLPSNYFPSINWEYKETTTIIGAIPKKDLDKFHVATSATFHCIPNSPNYQIDEYLIEIVPSVIYYPNDKAPGDMVRIVITTYEEIKVKEVALI